MDVTPSLPQWQRCSWLSSFTIWDINLETQHQLSDSFDNINNLILWPLLKQVGGCVYFWNRLCTEASWNNYRKCFPKYLRKTSGCFWNSSYLFTIRKLLKKWQPETSGKNRNTRQIFCATTAFIVSSVPLEAKFRDNFYCSRYLSHCLLFKKNIHFILCALLSIADDHVCTHKDLFMKRTCNKQERIDWRYSAKSNKMSRKSRILALPCVVLQL